MSEFWTAADGAELDVLVFEFVRVHEVHVPACEVCRQRGPWCPRLLGAFDAVLDWRQGRELRSQAAWLRRRELERERMLGRVQIAFDEHGDVVEYAIAPADEQAAA